MCISSGDQVGMIFHFYIRVQMLTPFSRIGKDPGATSKFEYQLCGVGCYIGNDFVGALAYADDIVIIAPSAYATRKLLNFCDNFANVYHILFNAEKSKCLAFLLKNRRYLSVHLITGLFNIVIIQLNSFSHIRTLITLSTQIYKMMTIFLVGVLILLVK
jgi:hypothetical protein